MGTRTYLSTKAPLRDEAGKIVGIAGVSTDITQRKADEAHREFLMQELTHRSKNLLAVIQAVAAQSVASSKDISDFNAAFSGRLQALSKLHDLLIAKQWSGAPLADLVTAQLDAFADHARLDASGPPVNLSPSAAQTISLALHELATNATKYGALSTAGGKVQIRWEYMGSGENSRFLMTWSESGGPVVKPPRRRGFGSRVLERIVASKGATARLDFDTSGVCWTMSIPADQL